MQPSSSPQNLLLSGILLPKELPVAWNKQNNAVCLTLYCIHHLLHTLYLYLGLFSRVTKQCDPSSSLAGCIYSTWASHASLVNLNYFMLQSDPGKYCIVVHYIVLEATKIKFKPGPIILSVAIKSVIYPQPSKFTSNHPHYIRQIEAIKRKHRLRYLYQFWLCFRRTPRGWSRECQNKGGSIWCI